MRAVLEDDPEYYYEGRFSVNSWKSDKTHSSITINYSVAPYKKKLHKTYFVIEGKSNPTPVIITKDIYGSMPTSPKLRVSATKSDVEMTLNFKNETLGISFNNRVVESGVIIIPEMVLYGEQVEITAKLTGSASYLKDSDGNDILDNTGTAIGSDKSGSISFECDYGRL